MLVELQENAITKETGLFTENGRSYAVYNPNKSTIRFINEFQTATFLTKNLIGYEIKQERFQHYFHIYLVKCLLYFPDNVLSFTYQIDQPYVDNFSKQIEKLLDKILN